MKTTTIALCLLASLNAAAIEFTSMHGYSIAYTGANIGGRHVIDSHIWGGPDPSYPDVHIYVPDALIAESDGAFATITLRAESGSQRHAFSFETATGEITSLVSLEIERIEPIYPYFRNDYDTASGVGIARWSREPFCGSQLVPPNDFSEPYNDPVPSPSLPDSGWTIGLLALGVVGFAGSHRTP